MWLLDVLCGQKIRQATHRHLYALAGASIDSSRQHAAAVLRVLAENASPSVLLGHTPWSTPVRMPLEEIVRAYSLVTGGTGSGKTCFALTILKAIIDSLPSNSSGFGILDPKGDLFHGSLFLLLQRLNSLNQTDPPAAKELRRRIVIYDFGSRDPVSSYNILARWPDTEAEFFASNRAEMLLDLLAGSDKLSLGGTAVLQRLLLLLSEFNLPLTYIDEVLAEAPLLNQLISESKNEAAKTYFARQFPAVPKATIAALRRRVEALFSSGSVRSALAGNTAPDFRRMQDEGKIVLVSCFGQSISRGVRRVLQGLVLSDIRQAVFARRSPDRPYLWLCDEAQNFFLTEKLRDNMSDLLTMSRSFGTFFMYLTQNMSTAVQDARMLKVLYTNIRFSFSMRGEPSDCAFLKSALPVTGRRMRPKADPFAEQTFCTPSEERGLLLDEIANLSDRVGYLWLKTYASEAIPMKTADLAIPPARDIESATASIKKDPTCGLRMSKKVYDRLVAERDRKWLGGTEGPENEMTTVFEQTYRRLRGKSEDQNALAD